MNILMMTNTYRPFVGGIELSIEMFTGRLRAAGHRVIIVVPDAPDTPKEELDVLRMPAIQRFNGSDFSVEVPIPGMLEAKLEGFRPHLVHSHHPFLMGDTALRIASHFKVPVVFTNHSFFEHYTHYVPGDSPAMKKFVVALSVGYANLCDQVIAPSESVREEIVRRGVHSPITVVPTGINVAAFSTGDRNRYRRQERIADNAFAIGIASRITPEKNLTFLAEAVSRYCALNPRVHFFLIGQGSSVDDVKRMFAGTGVPARLHVLGTLQHQDLIDAYHALDLFAYSSTTETQGIVLTEAMAAGLPIVALDAPGVRDVVEDGVTGRLLVDHSIAAFVSALAAFADMSQPDRDVFSRRARDAAAQFTEEATTDRLMEVYKRALKGSFTNRTLEITPWQEAKRWLTSEWDVISNMAHATTVALSPDQEPAEPSVRPRVLNSSLSNTK